MPDNRHRSNLGLHIFPKGNDRSWTREHYYGLNRVIRRIAHEQKFKEKCEEAFRQAMLYGTGPLRIQQPEGFYGQSILDLLDS